MLPVSMRRGPRVVEGWLPTLSFLADGGLSSTGRDGGGPDASDGAGRLPMPPDDLPSEDDSVGTMSDDLGTRLSTATSSPSPASSSSSSLLMSR
jgi:hypothetical protein